MPLKCPACEARYRVAAGEDLPDALAGDDDVDLGPARDGADEDPGGVPRARARVGAPPADRPPPAGPDPDLQARAKAAGRRGGRTTASYRERRRG